MKNFLKVFSFFSFFVSSVFSQGLPVPVISWPSGNATLYSTSVTLNWYTGVKDNNFTYEVELKKLTEWFSGTPTYDDIAEHSVEASNLKGNTNYQWRVRAKYGSHHSDWSSIAYFNTNGVTGGNIGIPIPSWPVGGVTVYTGSPTLHWFILTSADDVTYELEYTLQYHSFSGTPDYTGLHTPSFNLSGLEAGKTYQWRVRAKRDGQYTDWSIAASFMVHHATGNAPVTPILSWPIGGTTVYTTCPTLYWYLGKEAIGLTFDIELKKITVPFNEHNIIIGVSSQFFNFEGLETGTMYHWRVRSTNGSKYSDWSYSQTFITRGPLYGGLPVPILSWPIGNTPVYTCSPTLYWYITDIIPGHYTYEIEYQFAHQPFTGNACIVDCNETNFTLHDLFPASNYKWRVRVRSGSKCSDWSLTGYFNTNGVAVPQIYVPIPSWPTGGFTVYSASPTLYWYTGASSDGVSYDIELKPLNQYLNGHPTVTGVTDLFYLFNNLDPGCAYHWKVRSVMGSLKSSWSVEATFTVLAGASPVFIMAGSPVNGEIIRDTPVLSWFQTTHSEALMFDLQISANADMSSPIIEMNDLTSPVQEINNLPGAGLFYWQVKSKTSLGLVSQYSTVGSFSYETVTGIENESKIPTDFEVKQNYPNPFNPSTTIEFGLAAASNVSVRVFNMLGQEVRTLLEGYNESGMHSLTWHGDNNSGQKVVSGTYICRVTAGDNVQSMKMLMMK